VTLEQKRLIERAAALQTVAACQHLRLSVRDAEAFARALIEPQPFNDRMHDTVRRYREIGASDS
jgi:uncharacterized protein (DUF1778 family)